MCHIHTVVEACKLVIHPVLGPSDSISGRPKVGLVCMLGALLGSGGANDFDEVST